MSSDTPEIAAQRRFTVEEVTVRNRSSLALGPDDQVFYAGSHDDLSLGGTKHDFVILREVPDA